VESPELVAALHAADALTDIADELRAAFARAEAQGAIVRLEDYGPILARMEVAEMNFKAALERLR
jgi:hypothetical protein